MKKTKVLSVRLKSLESISEKCYKATSFDGSTSMVPKSVVFGIDYSVQKSDAYWIAHWFMMKENVKLQCGSKEGWYNPINGNVEPPINWIVEKHKPEMLTAVEPKQVAELNR
jgi:hypothetical protein